MGARRVPGFALAIVRGDEVVHQRGFGSAGAGRPVTPRTPFVLGSTTKSFTALAVMQLVDAGKVSLDAPISRYVPELQLAGSAERQITVRQLLNQTSGVPGSAGGRLLRSVGDGTMLDVVRSLEGTKLWAAPGRRFQYSNANYVLLGLVVERASGASYGAYVDRHIFGPLGMRDSFVSREAAKLSGLAVGHRYWFGFGFAHGPTSPDSVRSAGYLMSSASDMARYLRMWLSGGVFEGRRVVSEQGLRTLLEPVAPATLGNWSGHHQSRYAMGWFVGGPWREPAILHLGGAPDSSSMIVLLPERDVAMVALANANLELPLPGADGATDRIASGVVSLLVGEEPQTGFSLGWFYVIFDAGLALVVAAIAFALTRLFRRRRAPVSRGRRAVLIGHGTLEAAVGTLLLAAPSLTGQGYAGSLLWMPDLSVALLTIGGLLGLTGLARIATQVVAPSKPPQTAAGGSGSSSAAFPPAGARPPRQAGDRFPRRRREQPSPNEDRM